MVKLTQIDDETAQLFDEQKNIVVENDEDFTDTDESESDSDDEYDIENETLYDRLVALKDIVPPRQRESLSSITSSLYSTIHSGIAKSGNLLWIISSSALLLGVPLSLSILAESQLIEMEKEMKLQQSAQDVLAPGSEGAFQKIEGAAPATA